MTYGKYVDIIVGAVFCLLGGVFLYQSSIASAAIFILPGDAPPLLVPQVYLYLMIALALMILANGLRGAGPTLPSVNWKRLFLVMAMVCTGAVLMNIAGYLLPAMATVFGICWALGYRKAAAVAALSVSSVLFIWTMLVFIARLPLPVTPGLGI